MNRDQRIIRHELYPCWALVRPDKENPGQWEAHCVEYDVVSFGNSAAHAIEMVHEATGLVLEHDLNAGRDPAERIAPIEFREELAKIQDKGQLIESLPLFLKQQEKTGAQFVLAVAYRVRLDLVETVETVSTEPTRLPAFACLGPYAEQCASPM